MTISDLDQRSTPPASAPDGARPPDSRKRQQILMLSAAPRHRKTVTRVDGLAECGAEVLVCAYDRGDMFSDKHAQHYEIVSLGEVKLREIASRLPKLPIAWARARKAARRLPDCTLIWANSLDMLLLAVTLKPFMPSKPRIVYDVADLVNVQLSASAFARIVRMVEKIACRSVDLLVLTSPWFYWNYYKAMLPQRTPAHLLENKLSPPPPQVSTSAPGAPWRIVWNGLLRCRTSLEIALAVAKALPDQVEIHAWGRIEEALRERFAEALQAAPNLTFHGPYSDYDIAPVFAGAHFVFTFDLDDGANSAQLLPNRLYNGVARALPLLAPAASAIGAVTNALKLGKTFEAPFTGEIIEFLRTLTPSAYQALSDQIAPHLRKNAVYSQNDFSRVLAALNDPAAPGRIPAEPRPEIVLAR